MIEAPPISAWYVFGVVDAAADVEPAGTTRVVEGPVAALVRAVPLSEFGEDVIVEHLNDAAWLEAQAWTHESVLATATAATAVVPFRFGAVYRDMGEIARMLRERRDELCETLARVRGRLELGVKIWVDPARFAAPDAAPASSSGRAYLERRSEEQRRADDMRAELADLARSAHERLATAAVDAVANRSQPRELTGRDDAMILNGAYLVDDDGRALAEVAEALRAELMDRGGDVVVTGPWPPYNFVAEADG